MAEERIRIEQFEYEGFGHCGGFTTDGQDYFCEYGGESIPINKEFCEKKCPYDNSISRTEAIEKMARAISKAFLDDKGNPQGATDKELAKAALNALLGE